MLSDTIFESLRSDFKAHSLIFMREEVEKYLKGRFDNHEDYIKETTKVLQILTAGAIPLLNAAISVIKNAKDLPEDFKKSLVNKMGLYAYETIKKEFNELLSSHDIKTIEANISEWGAKTLLDILDDLEHVKANEQRMRMKVPLEFPLQLEYDRIAFFPPTSEKMIHFQVMKNGKPTEYFAEETDFPRYRWMKRDKNTLEQIGTFTIKNPFAKSIDNAG